MDTTSFWRATRTMTASDLRQRVRDRSVLVFGVVVPLALMAVFGLLFSSFDDDDVELDPIVVGIANGTGEVGGSLEQVLTGIPDLDISVQEVGVAGADETVDDGTVDVAVLLPSDFDAQVAAGSSPQVEVVESSEGGLEADVALSIVQSWVDRLALTSQAATVAAAQDPAAVQPVLAEVAQAGPSNLTVEAGETSNEQLSAQGYLVAGQAALFVFFTVGFGVVAYVYEREQGTLARLQSLPIPQRSIIVAKALASFVLGVGATTVLLVAGSVFFGVDFGDPVPIAVLVVALVAAVTSLVLMIIRVARTAEQAQVANTIIGLVMGVLGGSFFPVAGGGWLTTLSDLTPPAAFIRGLGVVSGGGGVADLGTPLAILFGFMAVAAAIGLAVPDRFEP